MEKKEIYNYIKGKRDITIRWDRGNGVLEKRCFVCPSENTDKPYVFYLASGEEIKPEEVGYENIISIT